MAPAPVTNVNEIKLEDIDFENVKVATDKHVIKRYIKLLEDDGNYFPELLRACKDKLLEVAPKEYYLLYPRQATDEEINDVTRDLLDWESAVKETDEALRKSREKVKKDKIWDDETTVKVSAPIRGQEPVTARPSLPPKKEVERPKEKKEDVYARDKSNMKEYYRAWDRVDVDAMEEEFDKEEQKEEESRRRHFEDLKEQQEQAQVRSPIDVGNLPDNIPEAHRKHLSDSEKEKGNEAFFAKEWAEAEAYYTRSLHFRADDPSTFANRALVRLKLEKPSGALQDCEHALALNPRYMKALHRKGKALYELERYDEAVRSFQLALAESPGNTQINGDLCVARRKLRSNDSAPPASAPRRVDAEPSCRIEELPDDNPTPAAVREAPAAGYTRVQIEEDSDSEDEEATTQPPGHPIASKSTTASPAEPSSAATAGSRNFRKVVIEEVSGSEDEDENPTERSPLPAAACTAQDAAPAAPFSPPARVGGEAPVPQQGLCFDDMD